MIETIHQTTTTISAPVRSPHRLMPQKKKRPCTLQIAYGSPSEQQQQQQRYHPVPLSSNHKQNRHTVEHKSAEQQQHILYSDDDDDDDDQEASAEDDDDDDVDILDESFHHRDHGVSAKRAAARATAAFSSAVTAPPVVLLDGDEEKAHNQKNNDPEASSSSTSLGAYWVFFSNNTSYQLFLASFIANQMGDWLTYIASMSAIESIQYAQQQRLDAGDATTAAAAAVTTTTTTTGMAVSTLIIIRRLPNILLAPLGGVLADRHDRRVVMIVLDIVGALTAWVFVLAVWLESIPLIYMAAFLQECGKGLYEPSRTSLTPLLVVQQQQHQQQQQPSSSCGSTTAASSKSNHSHAAANDKPKSTSGNSSTSNPNNHHSHDHANDLLLATTLTSMAWSSVAAFGTAVGGVLVSTLGLKACYMMDCLTYLVSAVLMAQMSGRYKVSSSTTTTTTTSSSTSSTAPSNPKKKDINNNTTTKQGGEPSMSTPPSTPLRTAAFASSSSSSSSSWTATVTVSAVTAAITTCSTAIPQCVAYFRNGIAEGVRYLRTAFFGSLIFLNASSALVYGGYDVLTVARAERSTADQDERPIRLGLVFCSMGAGCVLGPIVAGRFTDMARPTTLQLACIYSMAGMSVGCLALGMVDDFGAICFWNAVRSIGSSGLYVSATLLLQKFSTAAMLGRVASVDNALCLLTEAVSACLTGYLLDQVGLSPEQVSLVLGGIALAFFGMWSVYHWQGRGAVLYSKQLHSQ